MALTVKLIEDAVEKLREDGIKAEIVDDYSGRGMFGKTCYGVVTDEPDSLIRMTMDHGSEKIDNMGLDFIVYYPTLTGR